MADDCVYALEGKEEYAMRIAVTLCILLAAFPAWAGTWRDDFGDGNLNGWEKAQTISNGRVEEKDGDLVVTDIDRSGVSLTFFNNGQDNIRDFTLNVDVNMTKADTGDTYLWVVYRYTDTVWSFLSWEADNSHKGISVFQTLPNGDFIWNVGMVNIPLVFEVNKWYHYRLEMKGTQATVWIDDQLMAQADWANIQALPKQGRIGLGGGGGELHFDNFIVTGEEIPDLAVNAKGKLANTWAGIRDMK